MALTTCRPLGWPHIKPPCHVRSLGERVFDEVKDWAQANAIDWMLFATLTSERGFRSADSCMDAVRRWLARLDAKNRAPVSALIGVEPDKERLGSWHAHVLVADALGVSCRFARGAWKCGNARVDPFDPARGGLGYVAKAILRGGEVDVIGPRWDARARA
jgi:hypothetical protein